MGRRDFQKESETILPAVPIQMSAEPQTARYVRNLVLCDLVLG